MQSILARTEGNPRKRLDGVYDLCKGKAICEGGDEIDGDFKKDDKEGGENIEGLGETFFSEILLWTVFVEDRNNLVGKFVQDSFFLNKNK